MADARPDPGGRSKAPWRTIYFRLDAPAARAVALVGDFNEWNAERHPMTRNANGVWECQLPLPDGRYQYAFIVDGVAQPDPLCPRRLPRPDGSTCCLIEVSGPGSA